MARARQYIRRTSTPIVKINSAHVWHTRPLKTVSKTSADYSIFFNRRIYKAAISWKMSVVNYVGIVLIKRKCKEVSLLERELRREKSDKLNEVFLSYVTSNFVE